jgi:riboflavin biosynthesis pyrimidine reductase
MSIIATLVAGSDGSTTIEGTSAKVTSAADRENFLNRRRMVDCIITGGNSARNEPYAKTPVPLIVVSRQKHPQLPNAHVWDCDPCDAIVRAQKEFGSNILVEGGASLISYLLDRKAIDVLELSITQSVGGTDIFQSAKYLHLADSIDKKNINGTIFYTATFRKQK